MKNSLKVFLLGLTFIYCTLNVNAEELGRFKISRVY